MYDWFDTISVSFQILLQYVTIKGLWYFRSKGIQIFLSIKKPISTTHVYNAIGYTYSGQGMEVVGESNFFGPKQWPAKLVVWIFGIPIELNLIFMPPRSKMIWPFCGYHYFLPCDLDLEVWTIFWKL